MYSSTGTLLPAWGFLQRWLIIAATLPIRQLVIKQCPRSPSRLPPSRMPQSSRENPSSPRLTPRAVYQMKLPPHSWFGGDLYSKDTLLAIEDPNTGIVFWESCAIISYLIAEYDKSHDISYATTPETYSQDQSFFFKPRDRVHTAVKQPGTFHPACRR